MNGGWMTCRSVLRTTAQTKAGTRVKPNVSCGGLCYESQDNVNSVSAPGSYQFCLDCKPPPDQSQSQTIEHNSLERPILSVGMGKVREILGQTKVKTNRVVSAVARRR